MTRTFRDYARSFACGLVLGVSSLLPGCGGESVEHIQDVIRSTGTFPTYKSSSVEKAEAWMCEQSSAKEEDAWVVYKNNGDIFIQDVGYSPRRDKEQASIRYDGEFIDVLKTEHKIHCYHSHPKDMKVLRESGNQELLTALPSTQDFTSACIDAYINKAESKQNPVLTIVSGRYAVDYSISPAVLDQFENWATENLDSIMKSPDTLRDFEALKTSSIGITYYDCMKKTNSESRPFNVRRFVGLLNDSGLQVDVRLVEGN